MKRLPEWSLAVRYKMLAYGISGVDVATRLGKSPQWVSNVMTGYQPSDTMQYAICACVDELIAERKVG